MTVPPDPSRRAQSASDDRYRRPASKLSTMFRWFDNPFPEENEPQRLLALAALRRQIIEQGLGLTGAQADIAAFGLAAPLRAKLAGATLQPAHKNLLALGLFTVGQRDILDLLLDTLPDPAPDLAIRAFRLVLPLPRRVRRSDDPAILLDWFRRHYRTLKWNAQGERYVR